MRTIAPILLGLLLSVVAFADDDPPAAPSGGGGVSAPQTPSNGQKSDLVNWCNANLKDQSAICTAAGGFVCSLDDQEGCQKASFPKPAKIEWNIDLNDDQKIQEKDGEVRRAGEPLKTMAANCCSESGSGCKLPADAAAAQDNLKSAAADQSKTKDAGKGGALDTQNVQSGLQTNGVAVAGGRAQMCEAATFNCMQWANKTETDLEHASGTCGSNCGNEKEFIKGYINDCSKSLTSSPIFSKLTAGQGAQKQLDDVKNKITAGDPSSGAPASTPSKGTGGGDSGGGGDMSSMMKGLAQAAQAYMQAEMAQQQQTTPTTPATVPSAACSAASVGGSCPATPGTPTPAWSNGQSTLSQNNSTTPAGGSNVGDLRDQLAGAGPAPIPFTQVQPLASGTVPGGGGGGSGLGGSTPGGATLGGGVPANYARGGSGVDTNIMHGEGGGGFSQVAAAMNTSTGGGGGGWGGYGREPASNNFDLKSFLPGGRNDPSRGLAGGNVKGAQIQSSQVNIWSRISDHIKARCSQGLLRDCVP